MHVVTAIFKWDLSTTLLRPLISLSLSLFLVSTLHQFAGLHSQEKNEFVLTSISVCLREKLCHIYARGFQVATTFLPHTERCPDQGAMLNIKLMGRDRIGLCNKSCESESIFHLPPPLLGEFGKLDQICWRLRRSQRKWHYAFSSFVCLGKMMSLEGTIPENTMANDVT